MRVSRVSGLDVHGINGGSEMGPAYPRGLLWILNPKSSHWVRRNRVKLGLLQGRTASKLGTVGGIVP